MTGLSCLSITACHAPLDVLERLSYAREELARRLTSLRAHSRARAVAVLSTCQRTEAYATWPGEPDHPALLAALAEDRGIPGRMLRPVVRTYRGDMERVLLKTVHRLVHKPTLELRAAVEAGDSGLVSVLAGLFDAAPCPGGRTSDDAGLMAADLDAAVRPGYPALDVKR